jgi:hypothetical protein
MTPEEKKSQFHLRALHKEMTKRNKKIIFTKGSKVAHSL